MSNLNRFLLVQNGKSIAEKFHKQTQNRKLDTVTGTDYPESWIRIHFKTYPRLDKIKLINPNRFKRKNSLLNLINSRYSARKYTGESVSIKELSYLLQGSVGINRFDNNHDFDSSKRSYPSAGARYPLETYPLILSCKGIKKGLYHYNVKDNLIELLLEKDLSNWLKNALGGEKWPLNSSLIFIITTVLDRTSIKYGNRGYRYSLIEAGHIAQNFHLLSTELALGSCALGGFLDKEFDKLLDIGKQKEFTLYLIAVGKI